MINERSAMKVNTDGVLLGAAMTVRASDRKLLDVGTGTGTIALMAAQRFFSALRNDVVLSSGAVACQSFKITAIDIDGISVEEASRNFNNSPWSESLEARHASLDEFSSCIALIPELSNIEFVLIMQKEDISILRMYPDVLNSDKVKIYEHKLKENT